MALKFLNDGYFAGKVGIGTTSPEAKLTIKGDPNNTDQPVRITNSTVDAKTGLFINGTGNSPNQKYGMQFGGYNQYSIGGIFGVLDSVSGSTSGDITFDLGNGTSAGSLIERMRITHEGNVGIGDTPSFKLDVNVTSSRARFKATSGDANIELSSIAGHDWLIQSKSDSSLAIYDEDEASERIRIDSSGNVGIGTTSPSRQLDVEGVIRFSSNSNQAVNGYGEIYTSYSYGKGQIFIAPEAVTSPTNFHPNGGVTIGPANTSPPANGLIVSGNVGIGTTTPDSKLDVTGGDITVNTSGVGFMNFKYGSAGSEVSRGTITTDGIDLKINSVADLLLLPSGANKVGVGTTSPAQKLHVHGGNINIQNADGAYLTFNNGDASIVANYNGSGRDLSFKTYSGSSNTERMRIDKDGNVGIGTTSPAKRLHISASDQSLSRIRISNTNTGSGGDNIDLIAGINNVAQDGFSIFNATSNQTQLVIRGSGNVGIGTTSPAAKLHVIGNSYVQSGTFFTDGITSYTGTTLNLNAGSSYFNLTVNNAERMRVTSSGTVLINATTPRESVSKFSVQGGMSEFETTLTNNDDWQNSPISILERANIGSGSTADKYAPNLNFHWGGVTSKSLWMGANGHLSFGEYSSTGVPATNGTFKAGNLVAASAITGNTGTFTGLVSGITPVNAANFVTKAYVDGSGGGTGPFLPLAGGTLTGDLKLNDGVDLYLGTGNDFQAYHDGSDTYLRNLTGNFIIKQDKVDADLVFQSDDGSGGTATYFYLDGSGGITRVSRNFRTDDGAKFQAGSAGDLEVFHDGSNSYIENYTGDFIFTQALDDGDMIFKSDNGSGGTTQYFRLDGGSVTNQFLKTVKLYDSAQLWIGDSNDLQMYHNSADSYIENYTGNLTFRQRQDDGDIIFQSDNGSGGTAEYLRLDGGIISLVASKDLLMAVDGNGGKIKFGASQDLQIYHDGTNSYIENDTGDLYIRSNFQDRDIILQSDNGGGGIATYIQLDGSTGAVDLNHYGSNKLKTTSTGVTVTGAVTATTFLGDLNGTINTATTAVTKANATNDTTVATTAFVQNLIGTIPAGLVFQGTWNAATNTPTLTSGSGTTGHFYIVSTDGSTNLDGTTDWKVGDWAVFVEQGASDQWEKVDNSSVLDGSGTGQKVTKWDGSGTSNTLTDGPITFSSNDSTFAGNVTAPSFTGTLQGAVTGAPDATIWRVSGQYPTWGIFYDEGNPDLIQFKAGGNTKATISLDNGDYTGRNATFTGALNGITGNFTGNVAINGTIIGSDQTFGNPYRTFAFGSNANGSNRIFATTNATDGIYINAATGQGVNFRVNGGGSNVMVIKSSGNVGIGTTSPAYKLDVNGAIQAGGLVTYSKVAGSLSTTGYAVAGLTAGFNGASAGFEFKCYGSTGKYQRIVYSCYGDGTTWRPRKVIDEGTNDLDVSASADGTTITFTFKARSSTQSYSPRIVVQATGHSINSTYA